MESVPDSWTPGVLWILSAQSSWRQGDGQRLKSEYWADCEISQSLRKTLINQAKTSSGSRIMTTFLVVLFQCPYDKIANLHNARGNISRYKGATYTIHRAPIWLNHQWFGKDSNVP